MQIRSKDGTLISAEQSGKGPALVLVHGIAGAASRWITSRALGERFTLYALDRRGRGKSDDGPKGDSYAIDREAEDVAAFVRELGPDTFLLGHSFGGLLALEAAKNTQVRKLLVYEPFAPEHPVATTSAAMKSFEAITDPDALLERFLRDIVQMTESQIALFRASPAWSARVLAAHTISREMAAVERHHLDLAPLAKKDVPVRFLLGEKSPAFIRDATTRFHSMLRGENGNEKSDVIELEGQGHVAMDTAPALFEREVCAFFLET
jgi:pimeloyl-ACP methyl ester carboxylesterase